MSGTDALMGLLMNSSTKGTDQKTKISAFIQNDKGDELIAFLNSIEEKEKIKLLTNSITKFGENLPLRQAIHHKSFACIRSLILAGAEVSLPNSAILGRSLLLFNDSDDAQMAYIVLQSYQGPLKDLPFASSPPPGTCVAMIARSHFTSWRLLPLLAMMGLNPSQDDMNILAQKAGLTAETPSPLVPEIQPLPHPLPHPLPPHNFPFPLPYPPRPHPPHAPINLRPPPPPYAPNDPDGDGDNDDASSTSPHITYKRTIYNWLNVYFSSDHHNSLKNQCRIVIRRSLRVPDEIQVEKLRLPSAIKDYMLLRFAV